jgi:hypothetical protein
VLDADKVQVGLNKQFISAVPTSTRSTGAAAVLPAMSKMLARAKSFFFIRFLPLRV